MRAFFAMENRHELPKGTAERWARHTKDIKRLPEKKTDAGAEKKAFAAAFLLACERAGVTDPAAAVALADRLTAAYEKAAAAKRADFSTALGNAVGGLTTLGPLVGTAILPALAGGGAGAALAGAQNAADKDDEEVLRLRAATNAYRRQADQTKLHAQIRQLVGQDPKRYVVMG